MRLALKYRPRRFGDIAGQRATVAVLHRLAQRGAMPSALLFYGARGCGKTTSARILASALNCQQQPGSAKEWPCARCASCLAVANGTSLDVVEVDAASNGSVERIRELRDLMNYGTTGAWRVVILDEAHAMSRDAFNALLKILEEPPLNGIFILLTTEQGKILPTVQSRCMPFAFGQLPPAVIGGRLREVVAAEGIVIEDELLAYLADQADGSMRNGLMLLDQAADVGLRSLDAWRQLTGEEDYAPALLTAAAQGNHAALFAELDRVLLCSSDYAAITGQLVGGLRDVLVLLAGGEISAQGSALEARRLLAHGLDARRVVRAMGVLWDLQVRVRTEDRRAGLELAVVMVSEKLCPPVRSPSPSGNGHAMVGAAGLRAMDGFT